MNMTTMDFLSSGHRLRELIRSYKDELVQLNQLRLAISGSNFSGEGGGGGPAEQDARFVQVIVRIDTLEEKIKTEMQLYIDALELIRECINELGDRDERLIMRDRYILGMKWDRIAKRQHVSTRTARRIHDDALKKIHIPESAR